MRALIRANTSDKALLGAIAGGDQRAFDALYLRTAPALARFAWSVSASREVVEDLLQETFVTVWSKPAAVRVVNDSALPWLLITCRNHARNRLRRERRWREMAQIFEDTARSDPSGESAAHQLGWALDAIECLPNIDRRVCELVLLQGFSYREAATHLRISEASVGKRIHRSRQILRKDALG